MRLPHSSAHHTLKRIVNVDDGIKFTKKLHPTHSRNTCISQQNCVHLNHGKITCILHKAGSRASYTQQENVHPTHNRNTCISLTARLSATHFSLTAAHPSFLYPKHLQSCPAAMPRLYVGTARQPPATNVYQVHRCISGPVANQVHIRCRCKSGAYQVRKLLLQLAFTAAKMYSSSCNG
jgi:hypothetical protein